MKTIGVIFGGKSVEHEVSIITGHQVMAALEVSGYSVLPIFISKAGRWYAGRGLNDMSLYKQPNFEPLELESVFRVCLSADPNVKKMQIFYRNKMLYMLKKRVNKHIWADVFFPALHGSSGENGDLQGLFEIANVPYVGSGVVGSSVGMDKYLQKQIYTSAGIPTLKSSSFSRTQWLEDESSVIQQIENVYTYPVMVKPNDGGSTIGTAKAGNKEELTSALQLAFELSEHSIVEKALEDFFEINCAVFGSEVSVCEQPISGKDILTFDDKYKRGGKGTKSSSGMAALDRHIPAPIPPEMTAQIQTWAQTAYHALKCRGVARIDFLVDKPTNQVYINEINTLPGSLAFYLWEASGMRFDQLVDKLVREAQQTYDAKQKTITNFQTNLLTK